MKICTVLLKRGIDLGQSQDVACFAMPASESTVRAAGRPAFHIYFYVTYQLSERAYMLGFCDKSGSPMQLSASSKIIAQCPRAGITSAAQT